MPFTASVELLPSFGARQSPLVLSLSRVRLCDSVNARPPCPSPAPGACSDSCPLSRCCHPTISSSVVAFFCLQSFPASGSFPMRQFFASGGQSIGVSASTSVLPMNTQDCPPLGWTGWISLQSKGQESSPTSNFHIHK